MITQKKQLELPFTKNDTGKPQFEYVSTLANELSDVNNVMAYGAAKYARDNWRKGNSPEDIVRYKNAAIRHLMASLNGEVTDSESGLDHMAHAACNCLFILALSKGVK